MFSSSSTMQKEVSNRVGEEIKKEEKEEIKEVMEPYLPLSIIMNEILPWLPVEDVMRCRCVCKALCELPKDPYFVELQSSRSEILQHPYLVVVSSYSSHNITLNLLHKSSIKNGTWERMKIPLDDDKTINMATYQGFCNGLICTVQSESKGRAIFYVVYNPITREKTILPKFHIYLPLLGFGFDKRNNNYKLILDFEEYLRKNKYFRDFSRESDGSVPIITVGESSWRMLSISPEIKQFFVKKVGEAVFFDGGFHWAFGCKVDNNFSVEGILVLDISSEKFQTIIFSPPFEIHKYARPIQFGNSIGFFHLEMGEAIKIWKLLGAKDDGSCDYQFKTIKYHEIIPFAGFSSGYDLCSVLCNGDYVFKAGNNLVVYNQDKREYSHIEFKQGHLNYPRKIGAFMPTLSFPGVPQDNDAWLSGELCNLFSSMAECN